ncbi:MAG TPA: acyl-CoA dehydrogenase family protein [Beijerinckiaceae bacterium]|jgi:putative acyl-CoA dehydrogenase|nr:acyl-CoA dehydrogenase family protein [Beijerinckiaceae bacterium]
MSGLADVNFHGRTRSLLEDADFNQSPAFADIDLAAIDAPLLDAGGGAGVDLNALSAFARDWGSAESFDLAREANENPPKLRTVDAKGHRLDRVEFHPAYHALMAKSMNYGMHCSAFDGTGGDRAFTRRAAQFYLANQVENGHFCPITMTHAAVGALRTEPHLLDAWLPKIAGRVYDPAQKPWWEKPTVTLGMGMTERQGGTDVRANITRAVPQGDHAEIVGHKWFMSAPMCDAFLVLAQAEGGLTCYLMPRFRPDGSANAIRFQRLKSKLGNHSNASSEVEFCGAYAQRVGPEGRGVPTIIEMVQLTRFDCIVGSAGEMRAGLAQAIHHMRHRSVFQKHLVDQPAMRAVIADLALEMEAIVALFFGLARAFERGAERSDTSYARLIIPAAKYFVCKSAPPFVYEALECMGGNGYVEELPLARLYREAPLNAIWEGSGNVMALDVLRAIGRHPEEAMSVLDSFARATADVFQAQPLVNALTKLMRSGEAERRARYVCESLAHLAALAALCEAGSRFAPDYARTRLDGQARGTWGVCDLRRSEAALIERAFAA